MKTYAITDFKAQCIAILKGIKRSKEPASITIRGEEVAVIYPPLAKKTKRELGSQKGSLQILGDIVSCDFSADWDALSE